MPNPDPAAASDVTPNSQPQTSVARALTAGVTGHRLNRLDPAQLERLARQSDEVLAMLQAGRPAATCTLLSGLAEGADRIVAAAALARGWRLYAVLPFHRSRYAEDFPGSIAEFNAFLAQATWISEPDRRWHVGRVAEDGYEQQASDIVNRADALIAIWDGEPAQGPGGTVDAIANARAAGKRVVWINARNDLPPSTLAALPPAPQP